MLRVLRDRAQAQAKGGEVNEPVFLASNPERPRAMSGGLRRARLAKPKAKKGFQDQFCHNETRVYARSGDKWVRTTIYSGVRYLLDPIEPEENYPFVNKLRSKSK